ncbi:hypothetical protein ACFOTA_20075 [Chitinophaga sp. GCM10012297]|uniref:Kelch motif-containing protein n=1 Tax=Chitinophaga chungangae TaxID=2821488 RepID=A0ABS3YIK7_9BACT|nr:hypothetical protein [Chitinophaga chungangae]MBO9154521.1 hypothetical protein [Chitinophaga chungangae]
MGKHLFFICWTLVYSHIIFGQSHGLGFSSHEVVPEKRTSLHLTPGGPVCLREQTDLSFDLEFRPNMETYFGYIVRVITTDHQNIDLVYNQRLGVFHCVIGEKVTGEFRIDTLQLYRGWNNIRISFDPKAGEAVFYNKNNPVCRGKLAIRENTCAHIYFGATNFEGHQTLDLPPMNIKDVRIVQNGGLEHFFPLSESQGASADDTEGKDTAAVRNPVWLKPKHQNWAHTHTIETAGTPSIAFDQQKEVLYIITADSTFRLTFRDMQVRGDALSSGHTLLPDGNQSIYDPVRRQIYNVLIDEKKVRRYDTAARRWNDQFTYTELTEYWQANKFVSQLDTSLYILGGYGQLRYKNLVQRYHFPTQTWETVPVKGEHFMPRYLAALGLNAGGDTAFILGGYGSNTGDQSVNPKYNYELNAYSVRDRTFRTVWKFPEPARQFCFANSLVIDTASRDFYTLIYPTDKFNSSLQLIKGSLSAPEYQLMGDSIPYSFYDIRSFADLYYCPVSKKLVAVTLYNAKENTCQIRVYTLDFPPNALVPAAAALKKGFGAWWAVLPGLLLIAMLLVRRKRRGKAAQVPPTGGQAPVPLPEPVQEEPERSAVFLFGQFEAFDREGNDITKLFTPLLKELFLLVLIHTYKDGKGISSEQLFDILWNDKPQKDARNNYSVNIVKLKAILEKAGEWHMGKESGKWKLEVLNHSVKVDYAYFAQLCAQKNAASRPFIQELLAVVNRGAFLKTVQYEWLDDIKSDISGQVIDLFLQYISTADLHAEAELVLRLTHAIFLFDALNEEALAYRCRSLILLGRHGIAQEAYQKFAKEYKESYGQEFGRSFKEISQQG